VVVQDALDEIQIKAAQGHRYALDFSGAYEVAEDEVEDPLHVQNTKVGLDQEEIDELDGIALVELLLQNGVGVESPQDERLRVLQVGEVCCVAQLEWCAQSVLQLLLLDVELILWPLSLGCRFRFVLCD